MFPAELPSVSASSLRILTFSWLLLCKHVEGEPQISAAPGDDVILPCCLASEKDLQDYTVEWTKMDPAWRSFVYLYLNRKTMTELMMETLIPRVSLNPDGLKRGNVTLKIRNVTLQDEGTYRCFIPGLKHGETVHLAVDPNGVTAPTMETTQFNIIISTPDPGGDQTITILGLCIGLGVFTLLIHSAVCIFQWRRQKKLPPVKTSHLSQEIVREEKTPTESLFCLQLGTESAVLIGSDPQVYNRLSCDSLSTTTSETFCAIM
ncbi:hypothetical protein OJAV_G00184550 [Oryzias javanicus]|uniref:Ig-like domain-containing protein n=1 Tax=Oryzias javanicus TaxID=123683 RepID=A0A3S2LTG3_ORYJA|nr:hypothetical protein OJAV_G00184550 [Oryzias javanicus]